MAVLKYHPEVKILNVADTGVTDSGLEFLKFATGLEQLFLPTSITDKGALHLASLHMLRYLNISDTKISSRGLSAIAGLANLSHVFAKKWQLAGEGIGHSRDNYRSCKRSARLISSL